MKKRKWTALLLAALLCGAFLIGGCAGKSGDTIKIATKPMTEQFILSEMLAALIEQDTDLEVEITKGIAGGTGNIHPAMVKGDFDLYPEYTGTAWTDVLKNTEEVTPDEMYQKLQEQYKDQFNMEWVGLYGFNNTYTLAVKEEFAEQNKIETFSDLASFTPDMKFGAEYDFYEREDGYDPLCETYGYQFGSTSDLDIGLKYQAIGADEVDVINAFTTDGSLGAYELKTLEDDKNFFPSYYCGTIVREEALEAHPELRDVLMKMDGILTDEEMAQLNYRVENDKEDEKTVAIDFLTQKGLL
ncbi:glycine betaine ABC transporter substrate-binding protein [Christensenella tenuis]|uniref:Glycine/betaine ABC transporter substrate-binding protein n=1 Tax=Christensenella tenuis TaxID=2763033 RepID=A0ABR7EFT0_9FIRM|nr:glycine betaine ABC transporter substrate-binding protein [Christensenella tenuis]MBC5647904.1 glycine/betaine ABC transporter substrate-binding protein [Christensenella tenuis]